MSDIAARINRQTQERMRQRIEAAGGKAPGADIDERMAAVEPDAFRDERGHVWLNLRKHRDGMPGVFDATPSSVPLWFASEAQR